MSLQSEAEKYPPGQRGVYDFYTQAELDELEHERLEVTYGTGRPPNSPVLPNGNTPPARTPPALQHIETGGAFLFDHPEDPEPIWGRGQEVLWSAGEALVICGPPGVGKTTLATQILAGRLGLVDQVLGWPVRATSRKVLYLAMDRPQQIRRAMARLFTVEQRDELDEHLIVRKGPLPADLGKIDPDFLAAFAAAVGADTVVIDSLKDAVLKLSDDEAAGNYNRAIQAAAVAGIDVLVLHHQRKGQGGAKPTTLEDVYGNTWLTAGAGSVLLLWGAAGDPIVELTHLKQPAEAIGPLTLLHDHDAGTTSVQRGFDVLAFISHRPGGATVKAAARAMFEKEEPNTNQIEKVRRKLERLVRDGLAVREGGHRGGDGDGASTYRAVDLALIGDAS